MNIHQNARLTPSGRERLVRLARSGLSPKAVAETMGVCPKTVGKWVARFEAEDAAGLQDRSSRPHCLHRPTPAATQEAIVALRRQRLTGAQIARDLAVSPATVSRVLRRHGMSRIRDLEPTEPARRYERDKPGELIHIDIKKLGRFARVGHRITGDRIGQSSSRGIGWEYLHLAIDDHSRLAYSEIHPDEQRGSCLAFLFNALRFFRCHGLRVERVMTDNGAAFRSGRYAKALRRLGIAHKRTRPYTPKTNGKAKRFVQTSLREWAYARAYDTSEQRRAELPAFLFRYNWQRPHKGINRQTPISRLALAEDNLLRLHN
ncbi:IS481 family transposase [Methylorubrum rhodesianum]|uniref:IS481 family transposase n=1 Tax=Methylorubrum rhodesianum TaxID=29427 RepID=UPI00190BB554|nr:IS481 family transposase [Methylorubrum rhodesianum]MBK3404222.1 IS481 family transposase [Methylorubrum rhodesianum]